MAKKRKDVGYARKLYYLSMAISEIDETKDWRFKTDAVGIACQYSNHPKLRRSDFEGMMDMSLNDILKLINDKNEG